MKLSQFFSGILATIIGIQLTLQTMPLGYAQDYDSRYSDLEKEKNACSEDASKEWNTNANRCMIKEESKELNEDYEACGKLDGDQAKRNCYNQVVKEEVGEIKDTDVGSSALGQTAYGLAVGLAIMNFAGSGKSGSGKSGSKKSGSSCISTKIFNWTSLGALAGEAYFYFTVKSKLKKLKEDYEVSDAYQGQVNAFQYLKEEQETIKSIAGQKKTFYMLLTAAYGSATAMAIYEIFQNPGCGGASALGWMEKSPKERLEQEINIGQLENSPNKLIGGNFFEMIENQRLHSSQVSSLSVDEYKEMSAFFDLGDNDDLMEESSNINNVVETIKAIPLNIFENIISNAYAKKKSSQKIFPLLIGAAAGAGGIALISKKAEKFAKMLKSPKGVAVVSGICTAVSTALTMEASKQVSLAEKNIKQIDKTISQFGKEMAGFCPEGRDNVSNPSCFCYLKDGSKNPDRSESQVCIAEWNKGDGAPEGDFVDTDDKDSDKDKNNNKNKKGSCINNNREYDKDCECRKYVSKATGKNSCFKTNVSSVDFGALGTSVDMPGFLGSVDNMAQGDYSSGSMFGGNLNKNAARIKDLNKKLLKKLNKKRAKQGKKPVSLGKDLAKNMLKRTLSPQVLSAAQGGAIGGFANSTAGALKNNAKKDLKELAKKGKSGSSAIMASRNKRRKGTGGDGFNFSFDNPGAKKGEKVDEFDFEDAELDTKDQDVNTNEGVSIFQLLTQRYIKKFKLKYSNIDVKE